MLCGCNVKVAKPGAGPVSAEALTYSCTFFYDHRAMCLRVLTAEECNAMEPSA